MLTEGQNGTEYNQTLILNDDYTLNEEKLAVQGLPWFAATQTVTKIGSSLSFGATSAFLCFLDTHSAYTDRYAVTHIALWNGKQLWDAIKRGRANGIQDRASYLRSSSKRVTALNLH